MPPEIHNRCEMPHFSLAKTGPNGDLFDLLVVRGTFDFAEGKAIKRSETQSSIVYGDVYQGQTEAEPLKGFIKHEGDLTLGKPATDILLSGAARTARPQTGWQASLRVGAVSKTLQLYGPRHFERGLTRWTLTRPEAVTQVELDDRHAFGGCFTYAEAGKESEFVHKADNSAGCGWLPDWGELSGVSREARQHIREQIARIRNLEAPQLEAPGKPVLYPRHRRSAEGFGAIPPWHEARQRHIGKYDPARQGEAWPFKGFDARYWQTATPGLICPGYLTGDEAVELVGLTESGRETMRLPGWVLVVEVRRASGATEQGMLPLDTVALDLDTRRIVLKWRAAFSRKDPVEEIVVRVLGAG